MKKIIYSLVIMIAAGSLFTSCVTNTEPQGIKDIRQAKADYIDALSNLKKAEAEKVKAEAAIEQAKADYLQAKVEYQKIQNQIAQCAADEEKAKLTAQLKYWESELKKNEKTLAENKYALEKYLKAIALESKKLTREEQKAIDAYTKAYAEYLQAEQELRKAEGQMYDVDLAYANYVAKIQADNAAFALEVARYNEVRKALNDSLNLDAAYEEIEKFKKEWEVESAILEVEKADLQKEFNAFKLANVNESISDFTKDLSAWFVQNVALPAPFHMAYKTQLPDNEAVVTAFEKYMNNRKLVSEKNGFLIADGEIAANFNASPIARNKIFGYSEKKDDPTDVRSLFNVVDALSRELVIDTNATAVDTVGLAKAVADAKADYAKTKAALEKGVAEDDSVKAVQGIVTKAKADTANFNKEIAKATEGIAKAEEEFEKAQDSLDKYEPLLANAKTDYNTAVAKYTEDTAKVTTEKKALEELKKNPETTLGELDAAQKAVDDAEAIAKSTGEKLAKAVADTAKFDAIVKQAKLDTTTWAQAKRINETSIATNEAKRDSVVEVLDNVGPKLDGAKKEYYTNVYGKFWGIADPYDAENGKLRSDSLVINFTEETFTENPEIISFSINKESYKKGKFGEEGYFDVIGNAVPVNRNDELHIVWNQLSENQGGKLKGQTEFGKLLFAKVLFKEAVEEAYADWNTDDIAEAIARLQEICDEFAHAYAAASQKQVDDSEGFFKFLEGLIGEEVLEEVFTRIDNAIATYGEYKPVTPGYDPVADVIEQITEGTLSSRQVVIAAIENFFCGKWNSRAQKEDYEQYAEIYVKLQVAGALAGDQVEVLLLDILEKLVDALDIDIVKTDPGNIIEKLLFGTVQNVKFSDGLFEAAFNIVVPTITSYIVGDLGGIVGELTDKYFTEWAAAWAVYEQKLAEIQAKIDVYEDLNELYTTYGEEIEKALDVVKNKYAWAIKAYNWTNDALARIAAGADPYTLYYEFITDWVEYWETCVETAALKLKAAKAAYDQVIANHE